MFFYLFLFQRFTLFILVGLEDLIGIIQDIVSIVNCHLNSVTRFFFRIHVSSLKRFDSYFLSFLPFLFDLMFPQNVPMYNVFHRIITMTSKALVPTDPVMDEMFIEIGHFAVRHAIDGEILCKIRIYKPEWYYY